MSPIKSLYSPAMQLSVACGCMCLPMSLLHKSLVLAESVTASGNTRW